MGDKTRATFCVCVTGLIAAHNFPGAAQAADAAAEGSVVAEIIVTAQRRAERLQDVPLAISLVSGDSLEKASVSGLRDLATLVPGFRIGGAGVNLAPAIRGVSSQQVDPGNDANVSTYIDGIYQANQYANNMDLPDVARIEVLKGPQGTLFGRNATGGAVRIFTRAPSLTETSGDLAVGYGNFDRGTAKGFYTAPLIAGKAGFSLSGYFERSDRYDHQVQGSTPEPGTRNKALRGKLLYEASDSINIELIGSYVYNYDGNGVAYSALDGNSAARPAAGNPGAPGAVIADRPYTFQANRTPYTKGEVYSSAARITADIGSGELSSLTTYNRTRTGLYNDADASSADLAGYPTFTKQEEVSQELIYSSQQTDGWQFVTGLYYYGATGRYDPVTFEGASFPATIYAYMRQRTDAYAAFGELTYEPTDRLTLIAGARYSYEERDAQGGYFLTRRRPSSLSQIGEAHFGSFTPRGSLRYRLTEEDDNAYLTVSRGFKSGGFNVASLQTDPFNPETLTAYEVGVKTSPRRMLSANVAAFYYDYKNQQVISIDRTTVTNNAAASRIYGMDADITARVSDGLTLTAGIALLDAQFESYPSAVVTLPAGPAGCRCGNVSVSGFDLSGTRPPFAPEFTYSLSAAYNRETSIGTLGLSTNLYSTSSFKYDDRLSQKSYTTLSAHLSFKPADTGFSIYVWGKNLTDTRYLYATLVTAAGDGVSYAEPRSYGTGVRYAF